MAIVDVGKVAMLGASTDDAQPRSRYVSGGYGDAFARAVMSMIEPALILTQ